MVATAEDERLALLAVLVFENGIRAVAADVVESVWVYRGSTQALEQIPSSCVLGRPSNGAERIWLLAILPRNRCSSCATF